MISLPAGSRIWLVAGITDMRNGFNGVVCRKRRNFRYREFVDFYSMFGKF